MGIIKNGSNIVDIFKGTINFNKVYKGNDLVWQKLTGFIKNEVGDIVIYDYDNDEYTVVKPDDFNTNDYPVNGRKLPVGIVAIPTSHDVYHNGCCGVVATFVEGYSGACVFCSELGNTGIGSEIYGNNNSPNYPNIGTDNLIYEPQTVKNGYSRDSSISYILISTDKTALTGSNNMSNPFDKKTGYKDALFYTRQPEEVAHFIPSPYLEDSSKNLCYTEDIGDINYPSIFAYYNIEDANAWYFRNPDNYPAISLCRNYSNYRDWYCPYVNELGYVAARYSVIKSSCDKLIECGFNITYPSLDVWTVNHGVGDNGFGVYTTKNNSLNIETNYNSTWYKHDVLPFMQLNLNKRKRGVGDFVVFNTNTNKIEYIPRNVVNKIKSNQIGGIFNSNQIPIGVLFTSDYEDFYGDGTCGVLAFNAMSRTTPNEGTDKPIDYTTGKEVLINGADIPFGSYLINDILNSITSDTPPINDKNGRENTKKILSFCTYQPNWKNDTEIEIPKLADTTLNHFPAAMCTWRFSTPGTHKGDWYLPAVGEGLKIAKEIEYLSVLFSNVGKASLYGYTSNICDEQKIYAISGGFSSLSANVNSTYKYNTHLIVAVTRL